MNVFTYGTKYSFNTRAPFILGAKYENMKYCGTITYNIANKLGFNCQLLHRQIYHLLPSYIIDDPSMYVYHLFLDENNETKIFGDPWIVPGSIIDGAKYSVSITVSDILNDDIAIIQNKLTGLGYKEYTISKSKSTKGATNSLYQAITGNIPVGGGLEDNPESGEWEEDDGSNYIAKPILLTEVTTINPYINLIYSEFVDLLSVNIYHKSTEVQVASDLEFKDILYSTTITEGALNIVSGISKLNTGSLYYLRVRYTSSNNLVSKWSDIHEFIYSDYYISSSGRSFKRHSSDKGTVMVWKDKSNTTHMSIILDAKYRNRFKFIKPNVNTEHIPVHEYESLESFIGVSDADLSNTPNYFEDTQKSADTCSLYRELDASSNTAVGWSYNQELDHNGTMYQASLPSIQLAERIMADKKILDSLDPTAPSSKYNLYADTDKIWSCTKRDTRTISDTIFTDIWIVNKFVKTSVANSNDVYTVVPVIELS